MTTGKEKCQQLLAKWTDHLHTEMCQSEHEFTPDDFQLMRDHMHDMVFDFEGITDDVGEYKPAEMDDRDIERMRGVL